MNGLETSDEVLWSKVTLGDAEAFAEFYDRHEALLFGVALRILGNDRDAEDVLQDAAVLLWERAPSYRADLGRPISWAVTILRNKALDRLRSGKRRAEMADRWQSEVEVRAETSLPRGANDLNTDAAAAVRRTLAALPKEQRLAIELAFFSGLSQTEIAERVAAPLGTVKARIRRGMLAMRDALEGTL